NLILPPGDPLLGIEEQSCDPDADASSTREVDFLDQIPLDGRKVLNLGLDVGGNKRDVQELLWQLSGGGEVRHFLPHWQIPCAEAECMESGFVSALEGPAVQDRSFRDAVAEDGPAVQSQERHGLIFF